ncbi:MAG: hypothetical protein JXA13_01825 [Anaerolineales bacterium]|nr:hypothetical protein [Anaerolineales bacterium]
MNKRILIATALVIALVLVAQTGAWAGKLQAPGGAPAALGNSDVLPRPAGTGYTNPDKGGDGDDGDVGPTLIIEEYTGEVPEGAAEGATFLKVSYGDDDTLYKAAAVKVGPDAASAAYWDGEAWVDVEVVDGKITLPADAPNPCFVAVVKE